MYPKVPTTGETLRRDRRLDEEDIGYWRRVAEEYRRKVGILQEKVDAQQVTINALIRDVEQFHNLLIMR